MSLVWRSPNGFARDDLFQTFLAYNISVSWFKLNATRGFCALAANDARNRAFSCPERSTMSAQVLHNVTWPPAARIGVIACPQVTIEHQLTAHPTHNDHPSETCSHHGNPQVPRSYVDGRLHAEVGSPHARRHCPPDLREYFQV
jgi:hypothetical protein